VGKLLKCSLMLIKPVGFPPMLVDAGSLGLGGCQLVLALQSCVSEPRSEQHYTTVRRPLAAAFTPEFPSLQVFKAGRETESLLVWAKTLRMRRFSVNIRFSLCKGKKRKKEEYFCKRYTNFANI